MTDDNELSIAIGTDIVEIDRFRDLKAESPFYERVFSEAELAYCQSFSDPSHHLAVTFAGKEAVLKATNANCRASLDKIEILRDEYGAPYVILNLECDHDIYVSLSHSSSHAVAVALAVHKSHASNMKEIQEILVQTVKQIIPEGDVP